MENREGLIISSNITIQNSSFSGSTSYWTTTDITRQRVVLEIYDSQVKMTNCSFVNNNITPLKLTETHLTVSGNLNFTNNTAYRGGAIILIHNNTLSLSENSRMTFVGNRAIDTGGAVYVVTRTSYALRDFILDDYMICTNCFLSLHGISNSVKQLIFTNNSAGQGGDVVYGGRMESTCPIDAYNILDYSSCLSRFLEVSVINPSYPQFRQSLHGCVSATKVVPLTVCHSAILLYSPSTLARKSAYLPLSLDRILERLLDQCLLSSSTANRHHSLMLESRPKKYNTFTAITWCIQYFHH